MKPFAFIQARMGSSRLPGKIMKDICGKFMLERVYERVMASRYIAAAAVITSTAPQDQQVEDFCTSKGIFCFRGDENDVLDRYYQAARHYKAEAVVRITSDCPLIDPGVLDRLIMLFAAERPDYASNFLERSFPRGLDAEIMTFECLEKNWKEAAEIYQRTHVTPYIYQNPDRFRMVSLKAGKDDSQKRWTVDTAEDLAFVRAVYASFDSSESFGWEDVLLLLQNRPELESINTGINQKELHEG